VLSAHRWSLPALRLGPLRRWLPAWKSLANLSDPEWLADEAAGQIGASDGRPFAGLVFFGTSHFPYAPPYPDYLWRAGDYRGPFLYHAPPQRGDGTLTPADEEQVRARYDGALRAVDRAIGRLLRQLGERELLAHTVVVITSDHGEELYEDDGIAGHGDVVGGPRSQAVPVLILGPGAPAGLRSSAQVRLYDLAPTLLELLVPGPRPRRFGDGVSLLSAPDEPRPICVETGLWFWPDLPRGLRGRRLSYPGIADLLELDGPTREMVVRRDRETLVETAKARGLVLGNRLRVEQLLPGGRTVTERELPEIAPAAPAGADLAALFEERCLAGDPRLERYLGSVVWRPEAAAPASANVAPLPHHPAEIQ
jgi:hypothetical protein